MIEYVKRAYWGGPGGGLIKKWNNKLSNLASFYVHIKYLWKLAVIWLRLHLWTEPSVQNSHYFLMLTLYEWGVLFPNLNQSSFWGWSHSWLLPSPTGSLTPSSQTIWGDSCSGSAQWALQLPWCRPTSCADQLRHAENHVSKTNEQFIASL